LKAHREPTQSELVENLIKLHEISESLNQSLDVRGALDSSLAKLVKLMKLKSGWIFLKDPSSQNQSEEASFKLTAHYNLPPALKEDNLEAWKGGCKCQGLCKKGDMVSAYNEVRCSRLANVSGDRQKLRVHASAPLRSGDRLLGILNVAGPDWTSFNSQSLALLSNVGSQMGITLERARLYDMLQERHILQQAALLDVSNQLLRRSSLDDLTSYIVAEARKLMHADACALLLPGKEPEKMAFRASCGWRTDPIANHRTIPANENSGVGMVMQTKTPLLVDDILTNDPTPWISNWIKEEGFRGHAMTPLVAEDRSIGVLVIDYREPRLLNKHEIAFLSLMANQAAIAIENARLHEEEIKKQRMEQELIFAKEIQLSLLPKAPIDAKGWEISVHYKAANEVGGDFYDFIDLEDQQNRFGTVIADVSGKGTPAALFMVLCRTIIRTSALAGDNPSTVLARANDLILQDNESDLFVTAFYAILDAQSGELVFSNAGHNYPLWLNMATGEFKKLIARGTVLGFFEDIKPKENRVQLNHGDVLVFYTDGVTEARNPERDLYGEDRLIKSIPVDPEYNAKQILAKIVKAKEDYIRNAPLSDDCTIIVVRRSPAP